MGNQQDPEPSAVSSQPQYSLDADAMAHKPSSGPQMAQLTSDAMDELNGGARPKKAKRRNRWGAAEEKVDVAGLPTELPSNLDPQQLKQYLRVLRIEELSALLRQEDLRAPDDDDLDLPPATEGRVNSRDVRYRNKLEEERHRLVEEAMRDDPTYRPPQDYKRPGRTHEKVYIPASEFPEVNFIGLLIGPRGNTLKKMEADTGTKICIRGKGSLKEGKGARNGHPQPGEDEELHAMIMGDSEERVTSAVRLINYIIEESCSIPEGQNELKKQQLRELALLNGTLRDDEANLCSICNQPGHRRFECPERTNVTNKMLCRICGGVGHMAQDCLQRNDPEALQRAKERNQAMDSEYNKLMRELDGTASQEGSGLGGDMAPGQHSNIPPWRRQQQQREQQQREQQQHMQQARQAAPPSWPQMAQSGMAWPAADPSVPVAYDMSAYYGQDAQQLYMDPAYAAWAQQQWAQQGYANYGAQQ